MAKKIIYAVVAVFITWGVLDALIHSVILSSAYKATEQLWRKPEEFKQGVMLLTTLITAIVFVYIYARYVATKTLGTGIGYGLLFGIGFGVSMGYGSYSVMPIPYYMAFTWFLGTVVEGTVAGVWLGLMFREKASQTTA
ncbi:MAG: hypothetical protein GWO08_19595 [Gammaproteobacteria bacterium]|nr:hypothetical protein [Gammaproteobacteria bacterium]NIW44414.1 hypothetical protein [Gammaproteobacteria bacterium]NIX02228.1 hypothetical protein [Phycisphaerae bacterium]